MSDPAEKYPASMSGAASVVGKALVTALPPAFLLLATLNIVLVYLVLTTVENQSEQRLSILNKVIEQCLDGKGAKP